MATYTQHQMFYVDLPIYIQATTAKRTPVKNAITHKWINIVRHFSSFIIMKVYSGRAILCSEKNKKLSYRKQIARQLHTQYVENIRGISVTLKSG